MRRLAVALAVGGRPIADADDLSSAIARLEPAETAEVEIHRGGEARVLKVKLGERPLGSTSGG